MLLRLFLISSIFFLLIASCDTVNPNYSSNTQTDKRASIPKRDSHIQINNFIENMYKISKYPSGYNSSHDQNSGNDANDHIQGVYYYQKSNGEEYRLFTHSLNSPGRLYFSYKNRISNTSFPFRVNEKNYRHPGGIQVCGDYLAVALQEYPETNHPFIGIYDVSNIPNSFNLMQSSFRAYEMKNIQSVGLTKYRFNNSNYHLIVAVESSKSFDLQFYRSNGNSIETCTFSAISSNIPAEFQGTLSQDIWYQGGINLFTDINNNIYMVGFPEGKEEFHLFRIVINRSNNGVSVIYEKSFPVYDILDDDDDGKLFRYGGGMSILNNGSIKIVSTPKKFRVKLFGTDEILLSEYNTQPAQWKSSNRYDSGINSSISLDDNNNCIEVHNGQSSTTQNNLYYKVGKVYSSYGTVSWGSSTKFTTGKNPVLALNNSGYCIEIHNGSSSSSANNHYYKIGKLNSSTKTISWGSTYKYDTGGDIAIAIDDNGYCVEVHRGSSSSRKNNHYYRVGKINYSSKTVSWGSSTKYDTGGDLAIAMDNYGNCLEIHRGSASYAVNNLYYKVGKINTGSKTISWGSSRYFDTGRSVSVALDNSGNCIEVHPGSSSSKYNSLFFNVGKVNFGSKTVSWKKASQYSTGSQNAISLSTRGYCLDSHRGTNNGYLYSMIGLNIDF